MFPPHVSAALSAARASEYREAARRRHARAARGRASRQPVRRSPFGLIAAVVRFVLPRRSPGARRAATS
ncbi:MAG TPA: hypothetical protein VHR55_03425 [Candidatus Limnocylindria bacterium]|nr:hypothetical protein [Candidatus Limnocylindria bacterium]